MNDIHELKCWRRYYTETVDGKKLFEIRKNDRDFKVGDELWLREYDPDEKKYTGRFSVYLITFILEDFPEGLKPGFCALGIERKVGGENG